MQFWYKADGAGLPTLVDLFDEDVKAFDQKFAAMMLTDRKDKHPVQHKKEGGSASEPRPAIVRLGPLKHRILEEV